VLAYRSTEQGWGLRVPALFAVAVISEGFVIIELYDLSGGRRSGVAECTMIAYEEGI